MACPGAGRTLTIIAHTPLLQWPRSPDQQWPWDSMAASVYWLLRSPGTQYPSHCSLAYLLIKHFVRASGFLSSKQNFSFLQKKAISSMSKLPISFHCCSPEWGPGWHQSTMWLVAAPRPFPLPLVFLRALVLSSGSALSVFKASRLSLFPEEKGELFDPDSMWGASPNLEPKQPSRTNGAWHSPESMFWDQL